MTFDNSAMDLDIYRNFSVFYVTRAKIDRSYVMGNLTITGNGTVNYTGSATEMEGNPGYVLMQCTGGTSSLVIENGTFNADDANTAYGKYMVYASSSLVTVTVEGGTFNCSDDSESIFYGSSSSKTIITVSGGTYRYYNPADGKAVGIAAGFTSVNNGDGTWTVKADN